MKSVKTVEIENKLIRAGLSPEAISAAWPRWWSDEAHESTSAFNDLKFSLSRKLGLAPTSLFDEGDARFVWHGDSKFKGESTESALEKQALIGFAHSVSRMLLSCFKAPSPQPLENVTATALRNLVINKGRAVDLPELLTITYGIGIPVAYLRVFPLGLKRMTAMTVKVDGQYVILIARKAHYPSWLSFYIAHELGHILNGHLAGTDTIVDADIHLTDSDDEERDADGFALTLLTGQSTPRIEVDRQPTSARQLAEAVRHAGQLRRIDPGTLALCYGFLFNDWHRANGALKWLYGPGEDLPSAVNSLLRDQLDFSKLSEDNNTFISKVVSFRGRGKDSD